VDASTRQHLLREAVTGRKRGVVGTKGAAATSHPIPSHVAIDVLKRGGNACDAALAAAVTQTIVEPHLTTITGGMSLMYFDAQTGKTSYMNASMGAPAASVADIGPADMASGRGAIVPGWWAGFEAALQRHGSKSKAEVMAPAIELARDGFEMYSFLYGQLYSRWHLIGKEPQGREIFMPEGAIVEPGTVLVQERAARTLEHLRDEGGDYFYRGEFARSFCETVRAAGGLITLDDLASYRVRWQEPVWGSYRGYRIAGSPPTDCGGTNVIEALNMIELLDLRALGHFTESAETLYQLMRISELVRIEGRAVHDPCRRSAPVDLIVSKERARVRFEMLQMGTPLPKPTPNAAGGSCHVTVVDERGNVATMLHSCFSPAWSNALFVEGFSVSAGGAVHFGIRPTGPRERAFSGADPNITFSGERPILASGSPSLSYLHAVLQNLVNILDFGMSVEASTHVPRFGGLDPLETLRGEAGQYAEAGFAPELLQEVERRGHPISRVSPWHWYLGSFEGVLIDAKSGQLHACGDPRRTGQAKAY